MLTHGGSVPAVNRDRQGADSPPKHGFVTRRAVLALPFAAACTSRRAGFRGYAFIANEEGQAVAAVDLEALAVARHIPLDSAPVDVLALITRPFVYALTPQNGAIQEIQADRLAFARKLAVGSQAIAMRLARVKEESGLIVEKSMFVLTKEPKALVRVALDRFAVDWKLPLPEDPHDFAVSADGKMAVVSMGESVRLIDLATRRISDPLGPPADIGAVRFLSDSRIFVAANRGGRMLSVYEVASSRLIANLPIAVRPDNLCFSNDGGQLFITGEGFDGVVIVYPYHTPEVGQTVLAGHAPAAMAVSDSYLFVASPQSGDVSILNIGTQKVWGVLGVGTDPGFIAVTPDDQYALVLNRKSGDVAVLRVDLIAPSRYKERAAKLLTVIPVGSKPVSAAVRGV
jgi:DNA-binding beta-propeller fold protein YncE